MTNAPAITLSGSYMLDQTPLFSDVDLHLNGGEWTCLLGKSGMGKSTILRLILGLEVAGAFTGQITADDGAPIVGRASYMAQTDLLLPWLSLRENVVLGARLRGETADLGRADRLIDRVGLSEYRAAKPARFVWGHAPARGPCPLPDGGPPAGPAGRAILGAGCGHPRRYAGPCGRGAGRAHGAVGHP